MFFIIYEKLLQVIAAAAAELEALDPSGFLYSSDATSGFWKSLLAPVTLFLIASTSPGPDPSTWRSYHGATWKEITPLLHSGLGEGWRRQYWAQRGGPQVMVQT